jgi:hypothetical protein
MTIVDVAKLQIASFGDWAEDGSAVRTVINDRRPLYRKLVFVNDRITGAIFLGRPDDVAMLNDMGMVKGLIQTRTPLGIWKQHLEQQPLDVRRAYIGTGVAAKLLERTLLPDPSEDLGYRYRSAKPSSETDAGPHHPVFVESFPKPQE